MVNSDTKNTTSFPAAMMHYFGKKEGQETSGFLAELKALSDTEKAEFRQMLRDVGYAQL
jgi:hypothetical protein